MFFVSPIWLIGLVPWGALVVWVLLGRLEKAGVPFLGLWQAQNPNARRPRRYLERPPSAVAAMLLAILLGILAAAGPGIQFGQIESPRVTIIVDRGLTMSATAGRETRFAAAAEMVQEALPNATVELLAVPEEQTAGGDWLARARKMNRTAVVDPVAVELVCRRALAESGDLVVVLSDGELNLHDPRLIQVAPESSLSNVGIESLAVRAEPAAQAMVRVFNQSRLTSAELIVGADGKTVWSQQVDLPDEGQSKDYFVDLNSSPGVVDAQLHCADEMDLNHRAWVVRRSAWPSVEARSALPPELARMIEVYGRDRPATAQSVKIAVIGASGRIPGDMPTAIVVDSQNGSRRLAENDAIVVADGPLKIAGVDWSKVLAEASVSRPAGTDWRPIVSAGSVAVVAVRNDPVKQVWIGINSADFAKRADYVVFWSEIFQWLGGGGPAYESDGVELLAGRWTRVEPDESATEPGLLAGLYRSPEGSLRGVNASCPKLPEAAIGDWQAALRRTSRGKSARGVDGEMLVAALALVLFAAFRAAGVKS